MRNFFYLIFFLIFLVSCSSQPKKPLQPLAEKDKFDWQLHQLRIQNLKAWQAEGRLAAKVGEEGGQAHFTWQQNPRQFEIDVFGPFGAGHIKIYGNKEKVRLTDNGEHDYTAETPEALFKKIAGWSMPISSIHFWMRGIPDPTHPVGLQRFDDAGQLRLLVQNGWEIEYDRYESHPLTPLPTKFKLKNKDASIKLIVQAWHRYV